MNRGLFVSEWIIVMKIVILFLLYPFVVKISGCADKSGPCLREIERRESKRCEIWRCNGFDDGGKTQENPEVIRIFWIAVQVQIKKSSKATVLGILRKTARWFCRFCKNTKKDDGRAGRPPLARSNHRLLMPCIKSLFA